MRSELTKKMQSRVKNTARNTFFGALMYLSKMVLQFIVRAVFNRYFIVEYLGLNGLYSNILNILSLAELGVGNAIVYSMYKPIADGDMEKIRSLVALYKKLYLIIGAVITVIGLSLIPALPYLIKDVVNVGINLTVIYVLYLAQTVVGYFFAYRRSLVFAYQRNDIESIVTFAVQVALAACQIAIIIWWNNFYAYVSAMVIFGTLDAIIIYIISFKMFPEIKGKATPLDRADTKEIAKNTGALVFHKIGSAAVFSTDSIIISAFVSIGILGLYNNYTLVSTAFGSIVTLIMSATKSSIGNLIASADKEKNYKVFNAILLMMMWFVSIIFVGYGICIQDFITLLGGNADKQLPYVTAMLLGISFYLTQSRVTVMNFKECAGLFTNDKFKPLIEAGINLGLDLLLVHYMGINGVLLATIISTVVAPLWIEPYVLFKNYFKKNVVIYFLRYFLFLSVTSVSFGLTFVACYFLPHGGVGMFIVRVIICLIIPNIVYFVVFFKTPEFKYLLSAFKTILRRSEPKKKSSGDPDLAADVDKDMQSDPETEKEVKNILEDKTNEKN